MQIGESILVSDEDISCRHCDEDLGTVTDNVKTNLAVKEGPITNAGPTFVDPSRFVSAEMVFREFFCPGCGTLLFTETAKKGAPVVDEFTIETE